MKPEKDKRSRGIKDIIISLFEGDCYDSEETCGFVKNISLEEIDYGGIDIDRLVYINICGGEDEFPLNVFPKEIVKSLKKIKKDMEIFIHSQIELTDEQVKYLNEVWVEWNKIDVDAFDDDETEKMLEKIKKEIMNRVNYLFN